MKTYLQSKTLKDIVNDLPSSAELLKERNRLKVLANRNKRKLKSLYSDFSFLPALFYPTGHRNLDNEVAICSLFKKVGLDARHLGQDTNKEDIQIIGEDYAFVVECRSIKKGVTLRNDEHSQLSERKMRVKRTKEFDNKRVYYLAVVNFECDKPVHERINRLNSHQNQQLKLEMFQEHGFSVISTISLFELYLQFKHNKISKEGIIERLQQYGVIEV